MNTLASTILSLAMTASTQAVTTLFVDDFSADTSSEYATGGYVGWGSAGSLSISGNGSATFTTPENGFSYFGFGRSLGYDVLTTEGDVLTVSVTFSLSGISSTDGIIALYASNSSDATTSESPYPSTSQAVGTSILPSGGANSLRVLGDTGSVSGILNTWSGDIVYGDKTSLTALEAYTSYTLTMIVTRLSGDSYSVSVSLNGTELTDSSITVSALDSISEVGLRYYAVNNTDYSDFTMSITEFSATTTSNIPEPNEATFMLGGAMLFMLLLLRRSNVRLSTR
ncbi:MAG: hypothetical protein Q7Q73_08985 [Verrucomicrobiota bacterium JB024]|nr:hypothetical protein [Verrucomicrobiota bacterium JB024]